MTAMRFGVVVSCLAVLACQKQESAPTPPVGQQPAPLTGPTVAPPKPAAATTRLVPVLKPGEDAKKALGVPAAERDLGQPAPADDKVLEVMKTVKTDPGSLPHLQVAVDGKKLDLPLRHTQVTAELAGFVGRVEITQTYENPFPNAIEAIYVFPLPENAAVDGMRIQIGARVIEAEIKKREDARAEYEAAKKAGHTAALLEQERPNIFTQSIANIAPGETIDVVIRYVQDLTYDAGRYEFVFPMVVGPRFIPGNANGATGTGWAQDTDEVPDASRITPPIIGGGMRTGHDIDIAVVLESGSPVIDFEVPTHEVTAAEDDGVMSILLAKKDELPNRDFVLRWKVADKLVQGTVLAHKADRGGFFSLVLQPPKLDVDTLVGNRELVFVVDISGSMWGDPIALCKAAMREAIAQIRPSDTFNIVTFAGNTARAFDKPRPANQENIRQGLDFLQKANAGGGTYMADAVELALRPDVEPGRHRYVFFLTDGYVGNEDRLLADTSKFVSGIEAGGQRARVFGFGVGSSVNRMLLDGFGKAGKGLTVYVTNREEPTRAVNQFYRYIDHAVLSDLSIEWEGVKVTDVEPAILPDLFASRPLVLHGRYENGGTGTAIVRAKAGDQPFELRIPVNLPDAQPKHAALETLWARSRVAGLEQILWAGPDAEAKEAITALGLEHRIVTAFTSFVAVDRSRTIGNGDPTTVVQPVEAPEGVDMAHVMRPPMSPSPMPAGAMRTRSAPKMANRPSEPVKAEPALEEADDRPAQDVKEKIEKAATATFTYTLGAGTCSAPDVTAAIDRVLGLLRRCSALATKGTVTLKLHFGAGGRVTRVEVIDDTLDHKDAAMCAVKALRTITIPAGGMCSVESRWSVVN